RKLDRRRTAPCVVSLRGNTQINRLRTTDSARALKGWNEISPKGLVDGRAGIVSASSSSKPSSVEPDRCRTHVPVFGTGRLHVRLAHHPSWEPRNFWSGAPYDRGDRGAPRGQDHVGGCRPL